MKKATQDNLSVIANLTEMGAAVIRSIAGDEISTQIAGQRQSDTDIKQALAAKIQSGLITEGGSKK